MNHFKFHNCLQSKIKLFAIYLIDTCNIISQFFHNTNSQNNLSASKVLSLIWYVFSLFPFEVHLFNSPTEQTRFRAFFLVVVHIIKIKCINVSDVPNKLLFCFFRFLPTCQVDFWYLGTTQHFIVKHLLKAMAKVRLTTVTHSYFPFL